MCALLKVESEENGDASCCDSTHYEISLCVIQKKKILVNSLSLFCLPEKDRKRRICCFCCVSVVTRLVHFFLSHQSVCQNVEKTTKNERNSSLKLRLIIMVSATNNNAMMMMTVRRTVVVKHSDCCASSSTRRTSSATHFLRRERTTRGWNTNTTTTKRGNHTISSSSSSSVLSSRRHRCRRDVVLLTTMDEDYYYKHFGGGGKGKGRTTETTTSTLRTLTRRKTNNSAQTSFRRRTTKPRDSSLVVCLAKASGSDGSDATSEKREESSSSSSSSYQMNEKFSNETKLRSEAQAPFRVARQFLYASCALSATIGFGIATIQLLTGLAGAPNSPPFDQSVSNVGIDGACAALFVFLWKKDEEAKQKQMSRIGREERLGGLKVELTTGKIVRMQSLRGFSRVVLFAGDLEYLEKSLEVAEEYKDELIKKGVFLVPVAMDDEAATKLNKPDNAKKDERRFRGSAVNVSQKDGWRDWILEQKKMAKLGDDVGVYVGLRMDGRVRASGKGVAPFDRFAAELPPTDGGWGGMMDGFDGKVGVDN